jgi:uncharacterized integral membrane protein
MQPKSSGPDASEGFRPSGRQIGAGVLALVLVLFIAVNNDDTEINFVFKTFTLPLWLVLAGTALIGVLVGMGIGARRTKRKYMRTD